LSNNKPTKWPDTASDVLQIAFADMPRGIDKTPAFGLKDVFGVNYAIELPTHIVVAVKAPYTLTLACRQRPDVGSVVSIPQEATKAAERLGYEIILYVNSTQKYYLTTVSQIKRDYETVAQSQDRHVWVVPLKMLTEYTQAKADKMQGVLLL